MLVQLIVEAEMAVTGMAAEMEITGIGTAVVVEIPILHRDLQRDIRLVFRTEETVTAPEEVRAADAAERQAADAVTERLQKCNDKFKNGSSFLQTEVINFLYSKIIRKRYRQ